MRDYDVIDETTADDGTPFRVVIELDPDRSDLDPRHNDMPAGVIVALPPDSRHWAPQEGDDASAIVDLVQTYSFPTVARWVRARLGATVVLPLHHGSDGLTTGSPDDRTGPGDYVGVTFDTPTTRAATGIEPAHIARALESDVAEWATWARGEVYGWIVQRGELDEDGEITWDEDSNEESVWGYIGEEWAREAARVGLDDFVRAYDTDHPQLDDEDADAQRTELAMLAVG